MKQLSTEVKVAIKKSKVLFCNGYGFDDLSPDLLLSAVEYAVEAGTAIFFDPGPRGRSLSTGTPEEQRALHQFLRMSDVLLLTSDEVSFLTPLDSFSLANFQFLTLYFLFCIPPPKHTHILFSYEQHIFVCKMKPIAYLYLRLFIQC